MLNLIANEPEGTWINDGMKPSWIKIGESPEYGEIYIDQVSVYSASDDVWTWRQSALFKGHSSIEHSVCSSTTNSNMLLFVIRCAREVGTAKPLSDEVLESAIDISNIDILRKARDVAVRWGKTLAYKTTPPYIFYAHSKLQQPAKSQKKANSILAKECLCVEEANKYKLKDAQASLASFDRKWSTVNILVRLLNRVPKQRAILSSAVREYSSSVSSPPVPSKKTLSDLWALHGISNTDLPPKCHLDLLTRWVAILYGADAPEILCLEERVGEIRYERFKAYSEVRIMHTPGWETAKLIHELSESLLPYDEVKRA